MKYVAGLCRNSLLTAAAAFGTWSTPVFADVVFRDGFNAVDGSLIGTPAEIGGTWSQTGTQAANPIQISGSAASLAGFGQDAYAALSSPVANVEGLGLKTSLDLNVSAASESGEYFLHLSDPLGTTFNFYQRLFARSSAGGYQLGLLDTAGSGSTATWGTQDLSFGTTYHIDVQWNFGPGTTNDTFSLTLNDVPYLNHSWTSNVGDVKL